MKKKIDLYDLGLNLTNRVRFANKVAKKAIMQNMWTALLMPFFWVYAVFAEPKYWRRHCERMNVLLEK